MDLSVTALEHIGRLIEGKIEAAFTTTGFKKNVIDAVNESEAITSLKERVQDLELQMAQVKMDSIFLQNEWRNKVIMFRGLNINKSLPIEDVDAQVNAFLENTLKIQGIKPNNNKKIVQKDGLCNIVSTFEELTEAKTVLNSWKQLKGTSISMTVDKSYEQRQLLKRLVQEKNKYKEDLAYSASIWKNRYLIVREKATGKEWYSEILNDKTVPLQKLPNYFPRVSNSAQ
jgi:hypothetical protein